jgi:hypothetical protein
MHLNLPAELDADVEQYATRLGKSDRARSNSPCGR